jgi:hypothetical protein
MKKLNTIFILILSTILVSSCSPAELGEIEDFIGETENNPILCETCNVAGEYPFDFDCIDQIYACYGEIVKERYEQGDMTPECDGPGENCVCETDFIGMYDQGDNCFKDLAKSICVPELIEEYCGKYSRGYDTEGMRSREKQDCIDKANTNCGL